MTEAKTERTERESRSPQTTRPSTKSKRQREGSSHVGAFGKRTGSSDLVFLEGILPDTTNPSALSVEEQTVRCLDQLEDLLAEQGADLTDVMKVEVQLTDMDEKNTVDAVYRNRFGDEYPPRTTVGVCSLPQGADVQLDVIGADE